MNLSPVYTADRVSIHRRYACTYTATLYLYAGGGRSFPSLAFHCHARAVRSQVHEVNTWTSLTPTGSGCGSLSAARSTGRFRRAAYSVCIRSCIAVLCREWTAFRRSAVFGTLASLRILTTSSPCFPSVQCVARPLPF